MGPGYRDWSVRAFTFTGAATTLFPVATSPRVLVAVGGLLGVVVGWVTGLLKVPKR
jgi:hypothetical protein